VREAMIAPRMSAKLDAEARDWFVRLLDDVGPDELARWCQWIDSDMRHAEAYARVANAWELRGEASLARPSTDELARDGYTPSLGVERWRRAQRGRSRLMWSIAAAIAAVAVALGVGFLGAPRHAAEQSFATNRGQHVKARLSDGSRISLGALTTVKVRYEGARRSVSLDRGEAMFLVAHDQKRPFVVLTRFAAVTAVGTAFNIDIGSTAVTLSVTEGVVRVDAVGAPADGGGPEGSYIKVAAGQQLRMSRSGSELLMVQSAAPFAPRWQDGRLEYRDEPLRSVIDDVNRYANHPVIIADPDIGALTYTGSVKLESADAWVMSLPEAFPIRVEMNAAHQLTLKEKVQNLVPLRSSRSS